MGRMRFAGFLFAACLAFGCRSTGDDGAEHACRAVDERRGSA